MRFWILPVALNLPGDVTRQIATAVLSIEWTTGLATIRQTPEFQTLHLDALQLVRSTTGLNLQRRLEELIEALLVHPNQIVTMCDATHPVWRALDILLRRGAKFPTWLVEGQVFAVLYSRWTAKTRCWQTLREPEIYAEERCSTKTRVPGCHSPVPSR